MSWPLSSADGAQLGLYTSAAVTVDVAETVVTSRALLDLRGHLSGGARSAPGNAEPGTIDSYASIGSMADRGTKTCFAPAASGSSCPWLKKKITPSFVTAKS